MDDKELLKLKKDLEFKIKERIVFNLFIGTCLKKKQTDNIRRLLDHCEVDD